MPFSFNPLAHPILFRMPRRLNASSAWLEHIPFAMYLAEILRPDVFVELGTQHGDSYCAFCEAVELLGLRTRCYAVDTWEGDPHSGSYGPEVLAGLRTHHDPLYGGFSRLVQSTFDQAVTHFGEGTIDLLHLDGYHTYEAVRHDFETWLPKMSRRGVLLFHDVNVREGDFAVWRVWDEVRTLYPSFEFAHAHGLGVLGVGPGLPDAVRQLFELSDEESAVLRRCFFQLGHGLRLLADLRTAERRLTEERAERERAVEWLKGEVADREERLAERERLERAFHSTAQAQRQTIAQLQGERERLEADLGQLRIALDDLQRALQTIQTSRAWKLMSRYRALLEKGLPSGSWRRRAYGWILGQRPSRGPTESPLEGGGAPDVSSSAQIQRAPATAGARGDSPPASGHADPDLRTAFERSSRKQVEALLRRPDATLAFPPQAAPVVSIVTLTYNKVEYTYRCLESLLAHSDVPYELIVVDNASRDETRELLARLENVTVIRNDENHGFVGGCNQGARVARGKYLLFLNNDAQITPQTLSTLVETAESYPRCGAVGCKLVWPDGRLQEAGSIIWRDGSALGYGRGGDPFAPELSYLREVDYCSAACLLVRKELFDQIGGFDERYLPAYYEDCDLGLAVRAAGYVVVYQPAALVCHHEFTSSSVEGSLRLMEKNRPAFVAKWRRQLEEQFEYTPENVLHARGRAAKGAVLVIDDVVPLSDRGSGYARTYAMLRYLVELGHRVTFYPASDPIPWQPYLQNVQQRGVEVVCGETTFPRWAAERSGYYQTVIVSRPHNMGGTWETIEKHFGSACVIYDAEALFFARDELKAKVRGRVLSEAEVAQREREVELLARGDCIVAVSEREKRRICEIAPDLAGRTVVWGHPLPVDPTGKTFGERRDLLFVGGFLTTDSPNEDAVLFFLREIFPLVKKELDCALYVVGAQPPESVMERAASDVRITGWVEDISDYYDRCRVFVVPHRFAGGIPLKLAEAMSRGIPAVVSPLIAEQLGVTDGREVLVGSSPDEFAEKVIRVYGDAALWSRLRQNALTFVAETHDPGRLKAALNDIMSTDWRGRRKAQKAPDAASNCEMAAGGDGGARGGPIRPSTDS